jgi:predicted ATP-dependent endonuclease of OLD family
MFTDLHITDFRGITNLRLSGFNRVNLIVGENNTGKTSLLEALALVASPKEAGNLLYRFRLSSGTRNPGKWLRRDTCSSNVSEIILSNSKQTLTVGLATTETNLRQIYPNKYTHNTMNIGGWRLWTGDQHPDLSIRTVAVQHREPQNLVSDFSTAVRSKQGEKELEELLHAVDNRIGGLPKQVQQGLG